uniref:Uncharacterized protein n=1 Tax=Rhizophora mucronata TaxID=61149 RepID=A0A2P2P1K5_RHIMU
MMLRARSFLEKA